MNYTSSGALSGASSGAAAGTSILPGWGTVGGAVIGGALGAIGGSAADSAATRERRLRHLREAAQRQINSYQLQADQQAQARLRDLSSQRYASYGTLAQQLGGPERAAAGTAAGNDAQMRQDAALNGIQSAPIGDRSLVGGGASAAPIQSQLSPVMAARRAALLAGREQTGLQHYDTNAQNTAQNTSLDLSRQAQEEAQRQNVLAAVRQRMLAEAGIKYADRGATNGENNQMLLAQLGNAGLQVAGSYGAANRQNSLADELARRRAGNAAGGF